MVLPIFNPWMVNFILLFLLIIIKYFFFISAVQISRKGIVSAFKATFRIGIMKFKKIIIAYLIASLAVIFSALLIFLLSLISVYIAYPLLLVLFIPSVTFARIMIFYLIDKIHTS
ncbi:unnamed protein product [marine sediment metagenome]|uniref:Uncharacterized protein n=1 Tax=marine sediment metagenome TaxID=412755 RepID=X0W0X8_9ZZZZ